MKSPYMIFYTEDGEAKTAQYMAETAPDAIEQFVKDGHDQNTIDDVWYLP